MKHLLLLLSLCFVVACGDGFVQAPSSLYYSYTDSNGNVLPSQLVRAYFPQGCNPQLEEHKLICFCIVLDSTKYDLQNDDFRITDIDERDLGNRC